MADRPSVSTPETAEEVRTILLAWLGWGFTESEELNIKVLSMASFTPLDKLLELRMLRNDDPVYSSAQAYVAPLIDQALGLFSFTKTDYDALRAELLSAVPLAARRYLENPTNLAASYTFVTYFTWYISEGIDRHFHIRRVA